MLQQKKLKGVLQLSLIAAAATTFAAPAQAADASDASVQDLDQRVRILERQLEIQKEDADAKAKDAATVTADSKGFSIKNAKGDFELKFRGLLQADARFFQGDNATRFNDQFLLRRVEPTIEASLGKLVYFRVTPQFGGTSTGVTDLYGELRFDPAATLRAGKFKEPIGLENLQTTANLTFIERGLPTDLIPSRDFGAQLQGELFSSTLNYAVGIFNGAPDGNDINTGDGDNRHDIAARIFAEPFKNNPGVLQNLGFGISGNRGAAYGADTSAVLNSSGYVSAGQNGFFKYRAATKANGIRSHLSPQAYWYYNNYGLLGEYVISSVELANGASQERIQNSGFQVAANYVITGEDASYKGFKPNRPYKIGGDGWGAFEVAARLGGLSVDSDAFNGGATSFADPNAAARQARAYGIAANWYLTSNAKIAVNYEETRFKGGAAAGTDRENERVLLTRLQVAF